MRKPLSVGPGDDGFIARLRLRSIEQLDQILRRITDKAWTSTAIVKSQPVRRRLSSLQDVIAPD